MHYRLLHLRPYAASFHANVPEKAILAGSDWIARRDSFEASLGDA
jgi:hypothetical protein